MKTFDSFAQTLVQTGMEFTEEMIRNLIEVIGFDPGEVKEKLKERLDAEGFKISIYNANHKPYLRYIRLTKNDHFIAGYVIELKGVSEQIETFEWSMKYHATLIEDDEQDETAVKYLSGGLDHLTVERKGEENV